jgi:hypothetical protein
MTTHEQGAKPRTPPSAPRLRPALFEDYPNIHRLASRYFHKPLPADDWRRLYTDNPLWPQLGDRWPIGWVLEDAAGKVVGSFTNVPSLYQFRGTERICANGNRWSVLPEYRGYASWLMDEYFNQERVDLLINTTVGEAATQVVSSFADRVPLGDWQTRAFRIILYGEFALRILQKKRIPAARALATPAALGLRIKDALLSTSLPPSPTSVDIAAVQRFGDEFDPFWKELVRQNQEKLLAVRDSQTLNWHFGGAIRAGQLQIYIATRGRLLLGYCVLSPHSYSQLGLRSLRIVDYQTVEEDTDLLPGLIRTALERGGANGVHILEILGCGIPKMRAFEQFARARSTKASWSFYYRTTDPELEAELRNAEVWDPSGYDGDASYL